MCRYAHQDVYRYLGRDPDREPLTQVERAIFLRSTLIHVQAERKALEEIDV